MLSPGCRCHLRLTPRRGVQVLPEHSVSVTAMASLGHTLTSGQIPALGAASSVACGLATLPPVCYSMHAGSVLGHGLDHVQEKEPAVPFLAPVLKPLLHLLEKRKAGSQGRAAWICPRRDRARQGPERSDREGRTGWGGRCRREGTG